MKALCFVGVILALCSASYGGDAGTVTFDNMAYRLVAVNIGADGVITNDYVKDGETAEKWTAKLSVSHLTKADGINAAINPWLQSIRPQLTKKWTATRTPTATVDADVIVEAWIGTAGTEVEATLQRFVPDEKSGGVLAYRFVEKIDPTAPGVKEEYARRKYIRSEQLGQIAVAVVTQKMDTNRVNIAASGLK